MSEFTRSYDVATVRDTLGSKSDEVLVGLIGRIDWWKGHEYFLEAIADVTKKVSGLKGVIIGELEQTVSINRNRQYFNKLQSLIMSLGLRKDYLHGIPKRCPRPHGSIGRIRAYVLRT